MRTQSFLNTDNKSAASNNRTINNFDLPFATEVFDSLDGPSVDPNNFSEFPSRINSVQPSGKIDFAQFLNGKNFDSNDEALYQPTVNHNDQRENSELANIFDRSILSSCFSDQVGLKSDKSNCKETEHNYVQYLNKNLKQ